MGKPPSKAPVVTRASFSISGAVFAGQLVGRMQSTNNPSDWTLTAPNCFAIDQSGVISVTDAGVADLNQSMVDTTYTLSATAKNRWGTGTAAVLVYREAYIVVPVTTSAAGTALGKGGGMGAIFTTGDDPWIDLDGRANAPIGN